MQSLLVSNPTAGADAPHPPHTVWRTPAGRPVLAPVPAPTRLLRRLARLGSKARRALEKLVCGYVL